MSGTPEKFPIRIPSLPSSTRLIYSASRPMSHAGSVSLQLLLHRESVWIDPWSRSQPDDPDSIVSVVPVSKHENVESSMKQACVVGRLPLSFRDSDSCRASCNFAAPNFQPVSTSLRKVAFDFAVQKDLWIHLHSRVDYLETLEDRV